MPSPLQEVLVPRSKAANDTRSKAANDNGDISTAVVTRKGKITAYFTGRVIVTAFVLSFFLTAVIVLSRRGAYEHMDGLLALLSTLGLGLITWALATIFFLVAMGAILYRMLPRRRSR
ncbi:MAG: hypothetical protein JOZ30_04400 [Hyphomicrobiales bacterium]|nr:hypothetical protein [Hyphomicrobiales bacterium]